jgi:hypothetical protein
VKGLRASVGKVAQAVGSWAAAREHGKRTLRPLTAEFSEAQHRDYVDYLNESLHDSTIRNIALTGRYGSGKSSVLMQFAREHHRRVLVLSLSTLGHEDSVDENAGTAQLVAVAAGGNHARVNQIQKELVKQLLHREPPAKLPQSRYQRIARLTLRQAFVQSAAALGVLAITFWLFGATPRAPWLEGGDQTWLHVSAAVVVALAAIFLAARVRLAAHNRLEVSQVSAAGASVTVAKNTDSYFDKYLDEIVYFFESRPATDVVVFEDLDRFDEPGIFEDLRELNTLLNSSKQITARSRGGRGRRTIRFVYALRDSVFEQLGHDTKDMATDAAQAEAVRANRTKFFDLVIPLVPFITHRTARELLAQRLTDDRLTPVPPVSDDLVDLAARHIPDMRLLTNIRNEYSIFAKRLITDGHGMDTLTADQLFAMVVYKSLHLEDFELMLLGRSKLDTLYNLSRRFVNQSVDIRQAQLRKLSDKFAMLKAMEDRAQTWGAKLDWFYSKVADASTNASLTAYVIDGTKHETEASRTRKFWQAVLEANSGISGMIYTSRLGERREVDLDMSELKEVVGEGFRPRDWTTTSSKLLERRRARLLNDLRTLRTSDFEDLAEREDLVLSWEDGERAFSSLIEDTLDSQLACALVTDGYINRYYNLYIAQYYGERVPANAMSFIIQNVDPNRADFNYPFEGAVEIEALLKETRRSFLREASAYNIGILDYLLESGDEGAHTILGTITSRLGDQERAFLSAYLSGGSSAPRAVAHLAGHWPEIFTHLVEEAELSQDRLMQLFDVALAHSTAEVSYEWGESVRDFLQQNYQNFPTISETAEARHPEVAEREGSVGRMPAESIPPAPAAIVNAVASLSRAGFVCDDLEALRPAARRPIVESDSYALTMRNLRVVLGDETSLGLDAIRAADAEIYNDVLSRPDEYLLALSSAGSSSEARSPRLRQPAEGWTIEEPAMFATVLNDIGELDGQLASQIIKNANPECSVDNIVSAPRQLWEVLAECGRFPAVLANVHAYSEHLGGVDRHLAKILAGSGRIELPEGSAQGAADAAAHGDGEAGDAEEIEEMKVRTAEAVLGAEAHLAASVRAGIVASLHLQEWVPLSSVPSERGELLGHLLRERICKDEAATFAHFDTGDWKTLSFGIQNSLNFPQFATPDLVSPEMVRRIFESADMSADLERALLERLDEFVPSGDSKALTAAAHAALSVDFFLGSSHITTIATGSADGNLVVRLLHHFIDKLTPDEMLDVLAHAKEPYSALTTSGKKLTFPRTAHHEAVLQRLKSAGRISSRAYAKTLRKPARIEVEVL